MDKINESGKPINDALDDNGEPYFGRISATGRLSLPRFVELTDTLVCRKAIQYSETFVPAKVNDTLPAGYNTSASSVYNSLYAAWKAFDHFTTDDNAWMTAAGVSSAWIMIALEEAKAVQQYTIYDRRYDINQDAGGAAYAPYSWTFQGSLNGIDWVTLDTQTGVTWSISVQESKTYQFTNAVAYSYYRLNISANNGGTRFAIGELYIYDEVVPAPLEVQVTVIKEDSFSIADQVISSLTAIMTEAISILSTVPVQASKTISEIFTLPDIIVSGRFFNLLESLFLMQATGEELDIIEKGVIGFNNRISETGQMIFNGITEIGEKVFRKTFNQNIQVEVIAYKHEYIIPEEFHEPSTIQATISEVLYILGGLPAGLSVVFNEVINLVDSILSRPTVQRTLETIVTDGIIIKKPQIAKVETIRTLSATLRKNPLHNMVAESFDISGAYLTQARSYLSDSVIINGVITPYPTGYIIEIINVMGTIRKTLSHTLTLEVINILGNILGRSYNELIETINLAVTIRVDPIVNKSDIIRLMRLTTQRVIGYNGIPTQGITITETATKNPTAKLIAETLNLGLVFYKSLSRVVTERIGLYEPFTGLKVTVNKIFTDLFTITDMMGNRLASIRLSESLTLSDFINYPHISAVMLYETLRIYGTLPSRTLSRMISNSITVNEARSIRLAHPMIGEILNVSQLSNPMNIRVYLREYLKIIASFKKSLSFVKVEVLNILGNISPVSIRTILIPELIEFIDTRLQSIARPLIDILKLQRPILSKQVVSYRVETLNFAAHVYSIFGNMLIETIWFTDSIIKRPMPYINNKLYILPRVVKQYSLLLNEAIELADSLIKRPRLIFLEVINAEYEIRTYVTYRLSELVKLRLTFTKRPMKYHDLEHVVVSSSYSTRVRSILIAEVLTTIDTSSRMVSKTLVEIAKFIDAKCAKSISFVASETLAIVDIRYTTLTQLLQEMILLSDSKRLVIVLTKLEALLVRRTITKILAYTPFEEILNLGRTSIVYISEKGWFGINRLFTTERYTMITQSFVAFTEEVLSIQVTKRLSDLISMETTQTSNVRYSLVKEILSVRQSTYKRLHAYLLDLEVITLTGTKRWYYTLSHRLESVIKQVTKHKESPSTGKEKSIKKIDEELKRE